MNKSQMIDSIIANANKRGFSSQSVRLYWSLQSYAVVAREFEDMHA